MDADALIFYSSIIVFQSEISRTKRLLKLRQLSLRHSPINWSWQFTTTTTTTNSTATLFFLRIIRIIESTNWFLEVKLLLIKIYMLIRYNLRGHKLTTFHFKDLIVFKTNIWSFLVLNYNIANSIATINSIVSDFIGWSLSKVTPIKSHHNRICLCVLILTIWMSLIQLIFRIFICIRKSFFA